MRRLGTYVDPNDLKALARVAELHVVLRTRPDGKRLQPAVLLEGAGALVSVVRQVAETPPAQLFRLPEEETVGAGHPSVGAYEQGRRAARRILGVGIALRHGVLGAVAGPALMAADQQRVIARARRAPSSRRSRRARAAPFDSVSSTVCTIRYRKPRARPITPFGVADERAETRSAAIGRQCGARAYGQGGSTGGERTRAQELSPCLHDSAD